MSPPRPSRDAPPSPPLASDRAARVSDPASSLKRTGARWSGPGEYFESLVGARTSDPRRSYELPPALPGALPSPPANDDRPARARAARTPGTRPEGSPVVAFDAVVGDETTTPRRRAASPNASDRPNPEMSSSGSGAEHISGGTLLPPLRRSTLGTLGTLGTPGDGSTADWDIVKRRRSSLFGADPSHATAGAPLIGPNATHRRASTRRSATRKRALLTREAFAPRHKRTILAVLESARGVAFMTIVTMYALFADDVRLLAFDASDDPAFVALTFACLALFSLEMALLCVAKKGYPLGFYFWLDAVATTSLLMDVPDVMTAAGLRDCGRDAWGPYVDGVPGSVRLGAAEADISEYDAYDDYEYASGPPGGSGSGGDGEMDGAFARAARASRAGTRAGRIIRVVRLARVVRMYKTWYTRAERDAEAERNKAAASEEANRARGGSSRDPCDQYSPASSSAPSSSLDALEEDEDLLAQETRVGQRLSELTTRRVIVGVLGMLFVLPLFDLDAYPPADGDATEDFRRGGLEMLHAAAGAARRAADAEFAEAEREREDSGGNPRDADGESRGGGAFRTLFDAVEAYEEGTRGMYALVLDGVSYADDARLDFALDASGHGALRCEEFRFAAAVTPGAPGSRSDRSVSYAFFDARAETRTQSALNVARTAFVCVVLGLGALMFSRDANELVLKPIERMVKKVREVSENPLVRFRASAAGADEEESRPHDEQMETRLLENSIAKICGLLAVGFGEAGSEIIAENMRRGGEIDPMIPGKKMVAIFGFCDIRQFTDATEVLQEGVMEFVNTIGKIVHMEVHLHGGSANKNVGDAFLLVWKFPADVTLEDVERRAETRDAAKRDAMAQVANNALASFVVIAAGLRRSARLNAYRNDARLRERIPGFEVKMGFGLHVGWAIEGAIGSEYKVDASYLSPNVNLSARLEAATKQFGVPVLLSESFVDILSPKVAAECRQIDVVTVKGSTRPMGVFTYDVDAHARGPDPVPDASPATPAEAESNSFAAYRDEFDEHPDIVASREGVTREFLDAFAVGFEAYREGRWADARTALEPVAAGEKRRDSRGEKVEDGPARALLDHMRASEWKAPSDWKGYRELTEK